MDSAFGDKKLPNPSSEFQLLSSIEVFTCYLHINLNYRLFPCDSRVRNFPTGTLARGEGLLLTPSAETTQIIGHLLIVQTQCPVTFLLGNIDSSVSFIPT